MPLPGASIPAALLPPPVTPPVPPLTGAVSAPTGAAFDIVLIFHIGFMLLGLASLFVTGVQAWRARAGPAATSAASVTRYFRPGINWPGRSIYLVVVLGFVLIAMSKGAYDFGDPFVQIGLVLWIVAVTLAEIVVWPGEKHLQRIISPAPSSPAASSSAASSPAASSPAASSSAPAETAAPAASAESATPSTTWAASVESAGIARRVALAAWAVSLVLLVATVVMVQKP